MGFKSFHIWKAFINLKRFPFCIFACRLFSLVVFSLCQSHSLSSLHFPLFLHLFLVNMTQIMHSLFICLDFKAKIDVQRREREQNQNHYDWMCVLQKDKPQFRLLFVKMWHTKGARTRETGERERNPGKIIMNWRCGGTMLLCSLYLFFDIWWPRLAPILANCVLHAYSRGKKERKNGKKLVFVVRSHLHIDALVCCRDQKCMAHKEQWQRAREKKWKSGECGGCLRDTSVKPLNFFSPNASAIYVQFIHCKFSLLSLTLSLSASLALCVL